MQAGKITSNMTVSKEQVWSVLNQIPDPEIPVISIVELGITRDVIIEENKVTVQITPTYSGCPAMYAIEKDIVQQLKQAGIENVEIRTVFSPVWTTDWLNEEAKEKLRKYGIAPPEKSSSDKSVLSLHQKTIACPRCGSVHTELVSQFGSTACKALYKCKDCLEPFDYFKCH